jgi:zinc D-Ala-D-Ala carboxypeptidase
MHNDIPEAQRQQLPSQKQPSTSISPKIMVLGIVGLLILLGAGWFVLRALAGMGNAPSQGADSTETAASDPNILGHRPFEEADPSELTPLRTDPNIQLRTAAALAFESMVDDAQGDGVNLVAISGFRTKEDQEFLFFKEKENRNQNASQRAEVSAPPGHSEHHTGFAIDIGDGNRPDSHVEVTFADTEAFEWLKNNAARYSFEMSFPEGNEQGVTYEPWHWRFIGDQASLETFYRDR